MHDCCSHFTFIQRAKIILLAVLFFFFVGNFHYFFRVTQDFCKVKKILNYTKRRL